MANLNIQKTSDQSAGIMTYLHKNFLDRLEKNFVLGRYGKKHGLERGQGKTMDWRRWSNLSAVTDALAVEGDPPDGTSLTLNSVSATLAQYGAFASVTDIMTLTFINDIMEELSGLLGYQAALSIDSIIRNVLDAGLTIDYAAGTSVGGSNASEANVSSNTSKLRSNEVRRAHTFLADGDVPPMEDGFHIAVLRPLSMGDLMAETASSTGIQIIQYTDRTPAIKGFIGDLYGFHLIQSTNIRAVTANVYRNLFFGQDAYGVVDVLGSGKPEMIVHPTGSAGVEDPLNQRATMGWKAYFVAKVLEAARGLSYACYSV